MDSLEQWSNLTGADGSRYDPRPTLEDIGQGRADEAYVELWDRLHHQGDLGTAAYGTFHELFASESAVKVTTVPLAA